MEFDFEKFANDIDKRNEEYQRRRNIDSHIIDEDKRRRRRDELYHERWQNQIKWENNNGN